MFIAKYNQIVGTLNGSHVTSTGSIIKIVKSILNNLQTRARVQNA